MARTAKKGAPAAKRRAPKRLNEAREATDARRAKAPRRTLVAGSALLLFGLAMVGVDSSTEGAAITLLGLVILIYGIHRFGRLGPDEGALSERAGT